MEILNPRKRLILITTILCIQCENSSRICQTGVEEKKAGNRVGCSSARRSVKHGMHLGGSNSINQRYRGVNTISEDNNPYLKLPSLDSIDNSIHSVWPVSTGKPSLLHLTIS